MKDDITDEIILTRIRKETREIKEALDKKTGGKKEGKEVVMGDKAHQEMVKKEEDANEAKKRHMLRA